MPTFDRDVVYGASATRFTSRFLELISEGGQIRKALAGAR